MQVRVDEDTAAWWRALAELEGISVGELVRRAVATVYAVSAAVGDPSAVVSREGEDRGPAISRVGPGRVGVTVRTSSDPKRPVRSTTADVVRCPKASLHKKRQRCGYCGQTP